MLWVQNDLGGVSHEAGGFLWGEKGMAGSRRALVLESRLQGMGEAYLPGVMEPLVKHLKLQGL